MRAQCALWWRAPGHLCALLQQDSPSPWETLSPTSRFPPRRIDLFLVANGCHDALARRAPSCPPPVKVRHDQLFLSALCLVFVAGVWQGSCVRPLANRKRGPRFSLTSISAHAPGGRGGGDYRGEVISINNYSDTLASSSLLRHIHLEMFSLSKDKWVCRHQLHEIIYRLTKWAGNRQRTW